MMTLVFVHSPFVGAGTWTHVAKYFPEAVVPALRFDETPAPYSALAQRVVDAIPPARDAVIVLHSRAGSLAGVIAGQLAHRARAVVFVDAVLPHPGQSWLSTMPEDIRSRLLAGVHDGLLPRWDLWFPKGALETLISDDEVLATFVSELPRVPIEFALAPAPSASFECEAAYVRLSEAYETDARAAEQLNWPVVREPSHHLAMLTAPRRIAELLGMVLHRVGVAV